jgi:hypothetical protein
VVKTATHKVSIWKKVDKVSKFTTGETVLLPLQLATEGVSHQKSRQQFIDPWKLLPKANSIVT